MRSPNPSPGVSHQKVRAIEACPRLLLSGDLPKTKLSLAVSHVHQGRCALLKPGVTVDACVVPWRWHGATLVATAAGVACFEAGKEYEHGGISVQEIVTPVLDICRQDGA